MKLEQLSELFEQAIQIENESEQKLFIERSCSDLQERKKLSDLVQAHSQTCDIVDQPDSIGGIARSFAAETSSGLVFGEGSVIGNYRLLEVIGEGGMGQVFMADQLAPIQRRVAVKIIKADLSSRHILARFEAEREALSRLDHPSITRITDAGVTENGLPYFVMELVKGDSLIEYCDRNKLTVEDRIALLEKVCLAVHHAHQKGILHRDIKPTNIMVTMHDGVCVPKVIDFGIAKALDRPLTQQTLFTRYGDMVGTPQYMSPEQAEKSGLDIDSRTDVYSLGVVLYELLTGTTPIADDSLDGKGILGVLETVRDCDTESPSLRATRTASLDQNWATSRSANAGLLKRLLRGELDWITMKALSKDRNQRYDSAAAMANDLRCYLTGESVAAAAPTFRYHAKKMYQRHRAICFALVSAAILLVVTSLVSLSWAFSNARLTADVKEKSDRLEQLNVDLEQLNTVYEQARDKALAAESKALKLAIEKKKQAAEERAMARFLLTEVGKEIAGRVKGPSNSIENLAVRKKDAPIVDVVIQLLNKNKVQPKTVSGSDITFKSSVRVLGPTVKGFGFRDPTVLFDGKPEMQIAYSELLLASYRGEFGDTEAYADCLLDNCATLVDLQPVNWLQIESRTREALAILHDASKTDAASPHLLNLKASCLLAAALKGQGRSSEASKLAEQCRAEISMLDSKITEKQRNSLFEFLPSNEANTTN